MNTLELTQYTDYRLFLKDWLQEAKLKKGFSLRRFAARAGLGSPGYLLMVIDGKRNLGEEGLERFMYGMKLMGEDRLFFRNLVLWNQADTDEQRSLYEGKLALLRKCRRDRPHVIPEIKQRLEKFRGEILEMLSGEFTPEEASILAGQLLPDRD
jgi:uncharacterized protein (TIGR02147 family)